MRIIVELVLLCIALGVFWLQHRLKCRMRIEASKLIYWTTLLFVSITFNSILFSVYPANYNLLGYLNLSNGIVIVTIILGSIVLQLIAPSTSYRKIVEKIKANQVAKKSKGHMEDLGVVEIAEMKDTKLGGEQKIDEYIRELHFETFVETFCMLAIVSNLILEGCFQVFGQDAIEMATLIGLQGICVIFMMIAVPISIRQIIFYLYSLRHLNDKYHLEDVEVQFHQKLKKNFTRLN